LLCASRSTLQPVPKYWISNCMLGNFFARSLRSVFNCFGESPVFPTSRYSSTSA
jgi:hypothetical protein